MLCSLLKSTGVAGNPESYFRSQDLGRWSKQWGISGPDGGFDFAEYTQAAITDGQSENGVFAARIMWGTMEEVAQELRNTFPSIAGKDADLIFKAFGRTKFLHLQREDLVAQAVSRLLAEQTQVWHQLDNNALSVPQNKPEYDFAALSLYVQEAGDHQRAWEEWFGFNSIDPHRITYSQLDENPSEVVSGVLDFLSLKLPLTAVLDAPNKRLASDINEQWIVRFRAESRSS